MSELGAKPSALRLCRPFTDLSHLTSFVLRIGSRRQRKKIIKLLYINACEKRNSLQPICTPCIGLVLSASFDFFYTLTTMLDVSVYATEACPSVVCLFIALVDYVETTSIAHSSKYEEQNVRQADKYR